ncbi:MAG: coenzyme F420-0:L-glutamate ligase, partial [Thermodesulfobacteriota bacterium]
MSKTISLIPVDGVPEINPGDNLPDILFKSTSESGITLENGDILVCAQKIISKSENRIVDLSTVEPSPYAHTLSKELTKDPRLIEVILSETTKIIKMDQR